MRSLLLSALALAACGSDPGDLVPDAASECTGPSRLYPSEWFGYLRSSFDPAAATLETTDDYGAVYEVIQYGTPERFVAEAARLGSTTIQSRWQVDWTTAEIRQDFEYHYDEDDRLIGIDMIERDLVCVVTSTSYGQHDEHGRPVTGTRDWAEYDAQVPPERRAHRL